MIYFDSSALLKLLLPEAESASLLTWLAPVAEDAQVSSALARVEVARALRTAHVVGRLDGRSLAGALAEGRHLLSRLGLVPVEPEVLRVAAELPAPHLRSLDAVHIASAARYREELTALVTYDDRMLAAATASGLPTASPGSPA